MFSKILVANRGEIAVRLIRTCREMGIPSVAAYSDVNRASLHVRLADEAIPIGPAPAAESYLSVERLLEAARETGAEAIHPGFGFLSESAAFSQSCAAAGLVFVRPLPAAMELMGSKTRARAATEAAGMPVAPGTTQPLRDEAEAARVASEVGYPVMLKASAGGGGMRLVSSPGDIASAFGDGSIYIENAIPRPRQVEVQIPANRHGNVIRLGERGHRV